MLADAPSVQSTEMLADESSGDAAFAEAGSYAPKDRAPAEMVQLSDTDALTDMLELALPASAGLLERRPNEAAAAKVKSLATVTMDWFFMTISLNCVMGMLLVVGLANVTPVIGSECSSVIRAFLCGASALRKEGIALVVPSPRARPNQPQNHIYLRPREHRCRHNVPLRKLLHKVPIVLVHLCHLLHRLTITLPCETLILQGALFFMESTLHPYH